MSSFGALLIQGIRSFGPGKEDRGTIQFFHPLTLILGQNGCGKTTIIESLKYACTGEMPPGSYRGQCFVHFPNMSNELAIKAQVKLKFQNVRGEQLTVQRIMEAVQKDNSISVKTLDGTITRVCNGTPISVTKKCADMESDMLTALGVTKPILNFVIFCHQEDSNWPLEDAKHLKERFDAIFDATDYLNSIKKIKEQVKDLKQMILRKNGEVSTAHNDYAESQLLKRTISEDNKRLQSSEGLIRTNNAQRARLEVELRAVNERLHRLAQLSHELATQDVLLCEVAKAHDQLRSSLSASECNDIDLDGDAVSIDELARMLTGLQQTHVSHTHTIAADQRHLIECENTLSQLRKTESDLNVEVGRLRAEQELMNKWRSEMHHIVCEANSRLDVGVSDSEPCGAVKSLQSYVANIQTELDVVIESSQTIVRDAQQKLDDARHERTKLNSDLEHGKIQLDECREELESKLFRLDQAQGSHQRIDAIDSNLVHLDRKLSEINFSINKFKEENKLSALETSLNDYLEKIDNGQKTKIALVNSKSLRNEIDFYNKSIERKNHEVQSILEEMRREKGSLDINLDYNTNIYQLLDDMCTSLKIDCSKKDAELKLYERLLLTKQANEKQLRQSLAKHEQDVYTERRKLQLSAPDLETESVTIAREIQKLEKLCSKLSTVNHLYGGYIEKLESQQSCPLCHRTFGTKRECKQLIEELKTEMHDSPSTISQNEQKLNQARERNNTLIELRTRSNRINELSECDIPKLKTEIKQVRDEIEELKCTSIEKDKNECVRKLSIAEQLRTDGSRVQERLNDIRQESDKLAILNKRLSQSCPSVDEIVLDTELDSFFAARDSIQLEIKQLNDDYSQLVEQRQTLTENRNKLVSERLSLERLDNETSSLISRCESLRKTIGQEESLISELQLKLSTVDAKVKICDESRLDIREKRKLAESQTRLRLENAQRLYERIKSCSDRLMSHKDSENSLLTVTQQVASIDKQISECVVESERLKKQLHAASHSASSQENRLRIIQDHIHLREKFNTKVQIEERIHELNEEIKSIGVSETLHEKKRELEKLCQKCCHIVFETEGACNELKKKLRVDTEKLQKPQFSQADKVYKKCSLERICCKLAEKDLSAYWTALDEALISFHSRRMASINNTIRELWRSTYYGNDIDYIEIHTETGAGVRTSYNYRVVMFKCGVPMDMRGRCSSGQKMLASIIIRLALAETFGVNCGMLALDEPTTNLDEENVARLAASIAQIVADRSAQSNFQLVVITHDQNFIDILSRSEHLEHFYEVSRNSNGLSCINKQSKIGH